MEAPLRIDRSTVIRPVPAATRRLGPDLLANAGGATAPVQRLMGTGPELWECFVQGLSVGEAADQVAAHDGAPADVEANVVAFSASLVQAGLAEVVR